MSSLGIFEQPLQRVFAEAAGRVKAQTAQTPADFRIGREDFREAARFASPRSLPGDGPFLKQPPGRAHVPVVRMELIARQGEIALAAKDRPSPQRPCRKLIL